MQRKENVLFLAVLKLSLIKLSERPPSHGGTINQCLTKIDKYDHQEKASIKT